MKITVYTITDCEFSKQEKEYLTSHQLQFEEKNLETNKEFLTEMLAVSNNFAGTPVSKIEKDDGQIVVLKGFTKDEFDKVLGFAEEKKSPQPPQVQQAQPATTPPPVDSTPSTGSVQATSPQANDPLNSILADLQAKSVAANPNPSTPPAPEQTSPPAANQPAPSQPSPLPSVPDFPAKT